MHNILEKAIGYGEQLGSTYVDLRHLDIERTSINLKDGKGDTVFGEDKGTAIRVLANGAWGQVSTVSTKPADLKKAVKDAYQLAMTAGQHVRQPVKLAAVLPVEDTYKINFKVDPRGIEPSKKYDMVTTLHEDLMAYSDVIKTTTINYVDITGKQFYQNSEGTKITMDKCITWGKVLVVGIEDTVRVGGREEWGSPLGYHVFQEPKLHDVVERLGERVVKMLKSKKGKGGKYPVIMCPPVAGVFAHEAVGHLFEADLTLNGVVGQVLGQKIGSEEATIIDSGLEEESLGFTPYDDEGVKGQKTKILDRGRVNTLLTDRQYTHTFAQLVKDKNIDMDITPTGNARAFDFRVHPVIRMRDTHFAMGDQSLEELLESIDFGYYLKDFRGGQAQLNGTFTVGVQEAYEIIDGEIRDSVRGISMSGNTLETLQKISGKGKKDTYGNSPGRCGKLQTAFITSGSPLVRCDNVTISGES